MELRLLFLSRFVFVVIAVLSCTGVFVDSQLSPVDLTVNVGDTILLPCQPSAGDILTWQSSTKPSKIFVSPNSKFDSGFTNGKYDINGTYNLVINNANAGDAGTYECDLSSQSTNVYANVVVVAEVNLSDNQNGQTVTPGMTVMYTCQVQYSGPSTETVARKPLSPDQDLQLEMSVGGQKLNTPPGVVRIQATNPPLYTKSVNSTYTVMLNDAGKNVVCRAYSTNPQFEAFHRQSVNLQYSPRNVTIVHVEENAIIPPTITPAPTLPPGHNLNCSAQGNPRPTIKWVMVVGHGQNVNGGNGWGYAILPLTTQMMGMNHYQCVASSGNNMTAVTEISFTVDDDSQSSAAVGDNHVGLGVGLGIGLGVPVLVAIIVIIICLRKRKQSDQKEVTKPEMKSKPPPNTGTGKSDPSVKDSRPKRPDQPTTKNGPNPVINPNPNPAYKTPVYPEQTTGPREKTVRDSPGYGDLGVRHLGGSGSIPHLNESLDNTSDRSFDQGHSYDHPTARYDDMPHPAPRPGVANMSDV